MSAADRLSKDVLLASDTVFPELAPLCVGSGSAQAAVISKLCVEIQHGFLEDRLFGTFAGLLFWFAVIMWTLGLIGERVVRHEDVRALLPPNPLLLLTRTLIFSCII